MDEIKENIVPILLLILGGFLAYMQMEGWGWCVFGAIITRK